MSSSQTLAQAEAADRYGVAVLVPCYNEERAIGKVIGDFHAALRGPTQS